MKYKVLDTNILLLDANNLLNLGSDGSTIVLPETVLDEIDSKKSGHTEIAFQAREFGRLLTQATKLQTIARSNLIITQLDCKGVQIELVSVKQYDSYSDTETNIVNDRKIIYVAQQYNTKFKGDVVFISADVMCRHRADSLSIPTQDIQYVETTDIEFTREITLSDEVFRGVHNSKVLTVDPDYEPNIFNYKLVNSYTGQVKLATVNNGIISVIGRETEQDLRRQDINPANAEQLFFSKALQDPLIDINICEAKAGSGFN